VLEGFLAQEVERRIRSSDALFDHVFYLLVILCDQVGCVDFRGSGVEELMLSLQHHLSSVFGNFDKELADRVQILLGELVLSKLRVEVGCFGRRSGPRRDA